MSFLSVSEKQSNHLPSVNSFGGREGGEFIEKSVYKVLLGMPERELQKRAYNGCKSLKFYKQPAFRSLA